ncbi:MAG: 4Fe-4S binding protein [Thermoplasmata archaeon]|nr:4Fe-4S binding protein [Thermoplasmata archaeon]
MKALEIKIDKNLCKGCGICIDVCPKNTLESSNEVNEYALFYPRVRNLDSCIVCRLCELYCPDFAIEVKEK